MKTVCRGERRLINDIWELVDCLYLSGANSLEISQAVCVALSSIAPEDYSVAEWSEAVKYLTGNDGLSFITEREAQSYMCSFTGNTVL